MLIDKLPIELRELAEEERNRQLRKGLIKGSKGKRTIINSFLWYHSEKGIEFWEEINAGVYSITLV